MATSLGEYFKVLDPIIDVNGCLSIQEYNRFWDNLILGKEAISHFVTISIAQYMYLYSGHNRTTPFADFLLKTSSPSSLQPTDMKLLPDPESPLFYEVELTQQLTCAINNWKNFVDKTKSSSFVVTYLQQLQDEDENQKFLWLIENMYQISTPSNVDLLNDRDFVAASCIHSYLRSKLFKDLHAAQVIFEGITMLLGHPDTTRSSVLSLLHVFKQFVEIYPGDHKIVLSASFTLLQKKYFLWPKPYSSLASDILRLLTLEQKAPGNALRERFYAEYPTIIKQRANKLGHIVYLFVDLKCKDAELVGKLMEYLEPSSMSIAETQLVLLANIMDIELGIEPEFLGLEYLTSSEAEEYFGEAIQILKEAVMMNEKDAVKFKKRQLNSLKDKMLSNCTNSSVQVPLQMKGTVPRLPPLGIRIIFTQCDTEGPNLSKVLESGTLIPERHIEKEILPILQEHENLLRENEQTILRIGICGNDSSLHHLVGALSHLERTSALFRQYDVKIFFLPVENGLFAEWIGRKDRWFGRYVLGMTKAFSRTYPSIFPAPDLALCKKSPKVRASQLENSRPETRRRSLSSDSVMAEMQRMLMLSRAGGAESVTCLRPNVSKKFTSRKSKGSLFFNPYSPRHVFRHEVENYFREARHEVPLNIYRCECWFSDTIQSDLIIPFLLYAELGSEIEAGEIDGTFSVSKLRSLAITFQLKYCLVNFEGSKEQWIDLPMKPYSLLSLCNVPKDKEFSSGASPCNSSLDMVMSEFDKRKKLSTSCAQATSVEITSSTKIFIVLDGQKYGPCFKYKITKMTGVQGDASLLSFMSFLPFRDDQE